MTRYGLPVLLSCIALASCSKGPRDDVKDRNEAVESQKGRWQFIGQNATYPAIIFDSATGCVQTLERIPDGEKAGQLAVYGTYGNDNCGTTLDLEDVERMIVARGK